MRVVVPAVPGISSLSADLRRILPSDRVAETPEDLLVYGYDGTWLEKSPSVVVLPASTSEVAGVIKLAARLGVPVVPRGAGSGLAGGSVPSDGCIVLSTTMFDRITEICVPQRLAVVEPGVVNAALQAAVESEGLFYPPDPASLRQSTIGGNIATSASGPRCLKYGGTREYVLGLEVVTASGEVLALGGRSPSPGPDSSLMNLMIGSEGTLGIVTGATLRLTGKPAARGTVLAVFPRLNDASESVNRILESGVVPLALEMMDSTTLRCVEQHLKIGLPVDVDAILLVDVDGEPSEVARDVETVAALARSGGASRVEIASSPAEADRLWQARRSTSASFGRLRPNKLGEDISVPRSQIPGTVRQVQQIAARHDLIIPLFGHIGDGNLHPNILCDLRDRAEMERVLLAAEEIFSVALVAGGTLSGEHGIGLLKRGFLNRALDPVALEQMRSIKRQLDPNGILNPGKLL